MTCNKLYVYLPKQTYNSLAHLSIIKQQIYCQKENKVQRYAIYQEFIFRE